MERALALEGKVSVDDLRQGRLDDAARAAVGAAAVRLRDSPLLVPLLGADFAEVSEALDIVPPRRLLVVDSLQLTPPPRPAARLDERVALAVRALKALAVEREPGRLRAGAAPSPPGPPRPIRGRRWTIWGRWAPSSRTRMWC